MDREIKTLNKRYPGIHFWLDNCFLSYGISLKAYTFIDKKRYYTEMKILWKKDVYVLAYNIWEKFDKIRENKRKTKGEKDAR